MKCIIDNDLHIHSKLSSCSNDEGQTIERILQYAKDNGLKTICLADHFWDETVKGASGWYMPQDFAHISKAKPLPQAEGIRFLFGCETELNKDLILGLSKERYDEFDFIVIPITHLHMMGFTLSEEEGATALSRSKVWIKHFDAVLNMDLPFHKVGLAHLTSGLLAPNREMLIEMLNLIPKSELVRLFSRAAALGIGIELNAGSFKFPEHETDTIMRIFRTAKECGCKFYFGSDAHHPSNFDSAIAAFERAIDLLDLTEEDKFIIKEV